MLRSIAIAVTTAFVLSIVVPAVAKDKQSGGGSNQPKQGSGASKPGGDGQKPGGGSKDNDKDKNKDKGKEPKKGGGGGGGGKGTGGGGGGGKNKQVQDQAANQCPAGQVYQCRPNPVASKPQICGCRKPKPKQ